MVRLPMSLSVKEQVTAARRAALVVAEPDLTAFTVTGSDRLSWLNGMLTCELATRKPGDAIYGLIVTQKGRIVSDVLVLVTVDRALALVQRRVADSLAAMFERHLMMEDAAVTPSPDLLVLSVHGPRSAEVLDVARSFCVACGPLDRTGLGGAILAVASDQEAALRAVLKGGLERVGGAYGDETGWETLRLERGVPRFGVDFDETTYPQEASLEDRAVSFSKGCYLGQEVVCMLQMRGHVKRRLVSLVLDEETLPPRGAKVTPEAPGEGGASIGEITSASHSPTLGKVVALAMIKHAFAETGRTLLADARPARVVEIPA
jgi:folate-binding protein YgfZ